MSQTTKILKRWMALDKELRSAYGLDLDKFARRWGVSEKTVRRDLRMFRELGHAARYELGENGYVWWYEAGSEFMFTRNIRRRG